MKTGRLWATGLAMLLAVGAWAQQRYALLIGVERYEDSDRIATLNAADEDARSLGKALVEVGGFKKENVRVLTSDADPKPSRRNIMFEVGQLVSKVKPGDIVLIMFSGHGLQLEGGSFLIPWDGDLRNETSTKASAISADELRQELAKLRAKALVLAFDMCRNAPVKEGSRSAEARNTLGRRQAKDLVLTAAPDGSGPGSVVTLFSSSPLQRSWEWRDKKRGFFSYYLERGLRGEAADERGVVRMARLAEFVQTSVPSAVAREVGEDQTPYPEFSGPDALTLSLATVPPREVPKPEPPKTPEDATRAASDAAFTRGVEAARANRHEQAAESFRQAFEKSEKNALALYFMGFSLQQAGKTAEAEAAYRRALEIDPKFGRAHNNLGILLQGQRKFAEAEQAFRSSIAASPDAPEPRSNLALLILSTRGDLNETEKLLREAVALNPNDAKTTNNLAAVVKRKGDIAEAERLYRRAISFDPAFFDPVFNLANLCFQEKRDYDAAERLYEQAMALAPSDPRPHNYLGLLFLSVRRDFVRAEGRFRRAVELAPQDGEMRADWALSLFRLGREADARREANRAVELGFRGPHGVFRALRMTP